MNHETAKGLNALLDDLSARLGVSREEVLRRAIKLIEEDLDRTNGGTVLGCRYCAMRPKGHPCPDHSGPEAA